MWDASWDGAGIVLSPGADPTEALGAAVRGSMPPSASSSTRREAPPIIEPCMIFCTPMELREQEVLSSFSSCSGAVVFGFDTCFDEETGFDPDLACPSSIPTLTLTPCTTGWTAAAAPPNLGMLQWLECGAHRKSQMPLKHLQNDVLCLTCECCTCF